MFTVNFLEDSGRYGEFCASISPCFWKPWSPTGLFAYPLHKKEWRWVKRNPAAEQLRGENGNFNSKGVQSCMFPQTCKLFSNVC